MFARLICVLLLAAWLAPAASGQVAEYEIKAAYVYNLAKFVKWPHHGSKDAAGSVALCVLGRSPIRTVLEEAVSGETILGRPLAVRQLSAAPPASACHILFVASSARTQAASVVKGLGRSGTLTVGESDDFLAQGGAVNFKLEGQKVRIEINLEAVDQQGLRISPKLLSLARIVRKRPEP